MTSTYDNLGQGETWYDVYARCDGDDATAYRRERDGDDEGRAKG